MGKRDRNNAIGCLVMIGLVAVVTVLIRLEVGKTPPGTRIDIQRPTMTRIDATFERGLGELAGVERVGLIYSANGVVSVELDVIFGYNSAPFAEGLLRLAQESAEVVEFNAILDDGRNATDYSWRGGAWRITPLTVTAAPMAMVQPPGNCSTAVARGMGEVEAAGVPGLDRDGDGVACYGD